MSETAVLITSAIIIIALFALFLAFIGVIVSLFQKKIQVFQEELESVESRYEKELLTSQLEMLEQALHHTSYELHDNIGQFLIFAKLKLNTIDLSECPSGREAIQEVVQLITKALEDLRDLSKSMSLEQIRSEGMEKAIEGQVEQLRKSDQYAVDYQTTGTYEIFELQTEIFIFRILQETLNNILKHAKADKITITLQFGKGDFMMTITDNGKGFPDPVFLQSGEANTYAGGIKHLMERAALLGAKLFIESSPGNGTTVCLSVTQTRSKG